MKIKTIESNLRRFRDIQCGECFFTEGRYYMKINAISKVVDYVVNAISLESGIGYYILPDEEVTPVTIDGRVQNDSNT